MRRSSLVRLRLRVWKRTPDLRWFLVVVSAYVVVCGSVWWCGNVLWMQTMLKSGSVWMWH